MRLSEREKVEQENLDVNCLLILRAIVHNEILKMPKFTSDAKRLYHNQLKVIKQAIKLFFVKNIIYFF